MAETLKLGNGIWGTKENSLLSYNDENGNYKPLPFDFTRASSATVVNKAGLIETVGSGIPRIDFLGNTNGALKLEPQRTNLYTYSNDTSTWSKTNFTTTDNYATSPDGTTNAFRGVSTSNGSLLYISSTGSAGTNTISIYAKSNTGSDQKFRFFGNGNTTTSSDQTVTQEWQRFEYTETFTNVTWGIKGASVLGTNDILFYGMQHEVGSYPTSYIPTQGSTVTRNLETCSGAGNDQVINSTEGVLYAEIQAPNDNVGGSDKLITISDGTINNRVTIGFKSVTNRAIVQVYASGILQVSYTYIAVTQGNNNKLAFKYKLNNFSAWLNGVNVYNDTSGITPSIGVLNTLSFNRGVTTNNFYGKVKQLQVYDTALTDAELITLTT